MRILFMGTPEIAADCLRYLLAHGREVVGVVCQPDKPKGRGHSLTPPPTKVLAEAHALPVCQPSTLRDDGFLSWLAEVNPDLILVVAYGKILPRAVLEYPRYGCLNLHVSLLPKYRGAAPMQRAVMAGETVSGVSVMYMNEGMDTGDVMFQQSFPIAESDDFGAVHDKAAAMGAPLLNEAVDALLAGNAPRTPQDQSQATMAPKIEKEECHLNLTKSAAELFHIVRGLSPAPLAYVLTEKGESLKIAKARVVDGEGKAGQVIALSTEGEGAVVVACGEGALAITELVPQGKGKMSAAAYIRGRKIAPGQVLS
ncbi:MAG: methionyl-tRNA formyltransferase [Eubacteriales bacterium]